MTALVGIVNLTPDSFSEDGVMAAEAALEVIDAMIAQGADVIDIGAESTRPGARTLSPQEEWGRVAPVARNLGGRPARIKFSIDTRHAFTAERALAAGFSWINDVSGGSDPGMFALARQSGCTLVLMHSLSVPASSAHVLPANADPADRVLAWAKRMRMQLEEHGIDPARVILDPGIGFGKSKEQSFALIRNIGRLQSFGLPLLIGHSRKSFLTLFTDKAPADRDPETLAVSYYLASQNIDYLRVHDVKSHAAMLRIRAAL